MLNAPVAIVYDFYLQIYELGGGGDSGMFLLVVAILSSPIFIPTYFLVVIIYIMEALLEIKVFGFNFGLDLPS